MAVLVEHNSNLSKLSKTAIKKEIRKSCVQFSLRNGNVFYKKDFKERIILRNCMSYSGIPTNILVGFESILNLKCRFLLEHELSEYEYA